MRRWLLPLATGAVALLAGGLALAQPPSGITRPQGIRDLPLVEQGSQLYAANCSSCHAIGGRGVTRPPLSGIGDVKGRGPSLRGTYRAPAMSLRAQA